MLDVEKFEHPLSRKKIVFNMKIKILSYEKEPGNSFANQIKIALDILTLICSCPLSFL